VAAVAVAPAYRAEFEARAGPYVKFRMGLSFRAMRESKSGHRRSADRIWVIERVWSGRRDLNPRPLVPQTSALTGLRHAPTGTARTIGLSASVVLTIELARMLQPCRSGSSASGFDLRHVGAISLGGLEQMAVQVECHVDGR
jgi:hypothetical protein